ncbi:MAG: hypothetical protein PWQ37_2838 [Candidatus Petromonas sp.]|nr:hypothetical protein [Candidatus Petromonas sp.]
MRKLVIVNKKRFILSTTLLLMILFTLIMSIYALINRVEGYEGMQYIEISVKDGDTVWDLARKYTSNDKDVRKSIYKISKINNLNNYHIFPGQIIKIPLE